MVSFFYLDEFYNQFSLRIISKFFWRNTTSWWYFYITKVVRSSYANNYDVRKAEKGRRPSYTNNRQYRESFYKEIMKFLDIHKLIEGTLFFVRCRILRKIKWFLEKEIGIFPCERDTPTKIRIFQSNIIFLMQFASVVSICLLTQKCQYF